MNLEDSLKNLVATFKDLAEDASGNIKKYNDGNLQGFYQGKEQAYRLAAKWVLDIIADTKK